MGMRVDHAGNDRVARGVNDVDPDRIDGYVPWLDEHDFALTYPNGRIFVKRGSISRYHRSTKDDPVEPIMRHRDRLPNRPEPRVQGIPGCIRHRGRCGSDREAHSDSVSFAIGLYERSRCAPRHDAAGATPRS